MRTLFIVLMFLVLVIPCGAGVIYVDGGATAGGNGSDWDHAYKYLQDALYKPPSYGDEIWVAQGTYTPDANSAIPDGSGDREATFQLKNGVALYGGFPSGGGTWDQRDPNLFETILDGDLGGDDDVIIEPGPGEGLAGEYCADAGPIYEGDTHFNHWSSTTDGPNDCPMYYDIWYVYTPERTGHIKINSRGYDYNTYLAVYEGFTCPPIDLLACNHNYAGRQARVHIQVSEGTEYLIRLGCVTTFEPGSGWLTISWDMQGDNSRHVVTGSGTGASAILDGFSITAGNAPDDGGGGMLNESGSPKVANCTFSNNVGHLYGGGMYNFESNLQLTNCTFIGNQGHKYGGGMHNSFSNPTLINCTFSDNIVDDYGGGIYNEQSNPTLTNCTFTGNSSGSRGGGIYSSDSSLTVTNCTFKDNSANDGVGMWSGASNVVVTGCTYNDNIALHYNGTGGMWSSNSTVIVTDCIFTDNYGSAMKNYRGNQTITNCTFRRNFSGGGSAIGNALDAITEVRNCIFSDNSAYYGSGGLDHSGGSLSLENCTFSNNSTGSNGGALNIRSEATMTVTNCILNSNSAETGGGVYCYGGCIITMDNCTLWNNSALDGSALASSVSYWGTERNAIKLVNCILRNEGNEIWRRKDSPITIEYSNFEGVWPGEGNIDTDPLFVDADGADNIPGTEDDDLHLLPDSACIDTGDPNSEFDLEPEPDGGRVNMGAYGNTPEATCKGGLVLESYNLVSRTRVDRTTFDYVFTMTLYNNSPVPVSNVYAELLDASENVLILDPDVTFPYIDENEPATSQDTFTLRVDRSIPVDVTQLSWLATFDESDGASSNQIEFTISIVIQPYDSIVADITGEGAIDIADLLIIARHWLQSDSIADIAPAPNGDDFVDYLDFAVIHQNWQWP